jgi:ABC-type sugar transport system substrate-binding protein
VAQPDRAGAKGLIVVANDSKAIIPALITPPRQNVPVVSIDIGPDGGKLLRDRPRGQPRHGLDRLHRHGPRRIGDSGKVLVAAGRLSRRSTAASGAKGFHDCMTKEHPNVELIERPTDWDANQAGRGACRRCWQPTRSEGHLPAVRTMRCHRP